GICKVNYRTVADLVMAADHPEAQAIFVSCTNLPTYDILAPLERDLGKPVLTANQLTVWACLGRNGLPMVDPGALQRAGAQAGIAPPVVPDGTPPSSAAEDAVRPDTIEEGAS